MDLMLLSHFHKSNSNLYIYIYILLLLLHLWMGKKKFDGLIKVYINILKCSHKFNSITLTRHGIAVTYQRGQDIWPLFRGT